MPCSYRDIDIEQFDKKALEYNSPVIGWKRFSDYIFLVCAYYAEDFNLFFFNCMNNIDRTTKIQFTMQVVKDVLEFVDLKLTFDKKCNKFW